MPVVRGFWYPSTAPQVERLANGDIRGPGGVVIPFAASCPPDTQPDPASNTCTPAPGVDNVNFQCGSQLVPLNSPGCSGEYAVVPAPVPYSLAVQMERMPVQPSFDWRYCVDGRNFQAWQEQQEKVNGACAAVLQAVHQRPLSDSNSSGAPIPASAADVVAPAIPETPASSCWWVLGAAVVAGLVLRGSK